MRKAMKQNEDNLTVKALILDLGIMGKYCRDNNLDISKFRNIRLMEIADAFGFYRPSTFKIPEGKIGLAYDIDTQPVILLGIELNDGKLRIVETAHTYELKQL